MDKFGEICRGLLVDGETPISPLYNHYIIKNYPSFQTDWATWKEYSQNLLRMSEVLLVVCVEGWTLSEGLAAEISMAQDYGLPIIYRECW